MNSKKLITIGATTILSAAIILSGTFAWFTAEKTVTNKLSTDGDNSIDTEIVENFPNEPLYPGVDVTKEVKVIQTGTGKAITRVRLEETLQLFESADNGGYKELVVYPENSPIDPANASGLVAKKISREAFDATVLASGFDPAADLVTAGIPAGVELYQRSYQSGDKTVWQYIAAYNNNGVLETMTVTANEADPGNVSQLTLKYNAFKLLPLVETVHNSALAISDAIDHNYIELLFGATVKPISEWDRASTGDVWYYDESGWFYYGQVLSAGSATSMLLEKVAMSSEAGNEYFGTKYNLNVRMQSVQPTLDAATAEWNARPITVDPYFTITTSLNSQSNMSADALALVTVLCNG